MQILNIIHACCTLSNYLKHVTTESHPLVGYEYYNLQFFVSRLTRSPMNIWQRRRSESKTERRGEKSSVEIGELSVPPHSILPCVSWAASFAGVPISRIFLQPGRRDALAANKRRCPNREASTRVAAPVANASCSENSPRFDERTCPDGFFETQELFLERFPEYYIVTNIIVMRNTDLKFNIERILRDNMDYRSICPGKNERLIEKQYLILFR